MLLSPHLFAARRALRRGWKRPTALAVRGAAFWTGACFFCERTLAYFQTITALGRSSRSASSCSSS
jgi:hypothetical protein